jgi:predicted AlkP superfamily phosphohydrolase/phosphomutase
MTGQKPRVLVIGLDGSTLDLLGPWINNGQLPNLQNLALKGIQGNLLSTTPTESAPAWTSLVTGVNPGKHGIFGFVAGDGRVVNSTDVKATRLWTILSSYGLKCCIVNVPLTYPLEHINGVMVSGFPIAPGRLDYVYPDSVASIIKRHGYEPDVPLALLTGLAGRKWNLLSDEHHAAKKRFETLLDLMKVDSFDLLFAVFRETDEVQHFFWDEPHILIEFYRKLDAYIGSLVSAFSDDDTDLYTLVVSDHGFGPAPQTSFDLNRWIMGNFHMKRDIPLTRRLISAVWDTPPIRWIMRYHVILQMLKIRDFLMSVNLNRNELKGNDLYRKQLVTNAYGKAGLRVEPYQLYADSTAFGSADEKEIFISTLLHAMPRIQENGKKVFKNIWTRGQLYSGPYLEEAPDLIFTTTEDFFVYGGADSWSRWYKNCTLPGHHFDRPNGMIMLSGSNVKPGVIEASIYDVVPTILQIFGIPFESLNLDGRPLLIPPHLETRAHPIQISSAHQEEHTFSEREEEQIKDRLRRLGYM